MKAWYRAADIVVISPAIKTDDLGEVAGRVVGWHLAALNGQGIAMLLDWTVFADIRSGRSRRVLAGHEAPGVLLAAIPCVALMRKGTATVGAAH